MSLPTLAGLRAFQRELNDAALDPVLQLALSAAVEEIEAFIGFGLAEYEDQVPAVIVQCAYTLATITTDEFTAEKEAQVRGRVEGALRPYRREAGVRCA